MILLKIFINLVYQGYTRAAQQEWEKIKQTVL